MAECEICFNNNTNSDIKCKVCNKCICNKCCLNIQETRVFVNERTADINMSFKCPYCRDEENVINVTKNTIPLLVEMTKKVVSENQMLLTKVNIQNDNLKKQKAIIEKNIENTYVVRELNICMLIQRKQKRKTFNIDYIETI